MSDLFRRHDDKFICIKSESALVILLFYIFIKFDTPTTKIIPVGKQKRRKRKRTREKQRIIYNYRTKQIKKNKISIQQLPN